MGLLNWIKKLLQPQESMIRVNCQTMPLAQWDAMRRRRGSNPPAPGNKLPAPPEPPLIAQLIRYWAWEREQVRVALSESTDPPTKPQPTGGRLIYVDRDPGPVPPVLPDDLADLPVLTAQHLDGAAVAPAPAEMPSDELMEQWRDAAIAEADAGGEPTWRTAALLAFAEGWWQAQSIQLPLPGADPVATDKELLRVARSPVFLDDARRAIYKRGRADERTAILRALGVEP